MTEWLDYDPSLVESIGAAMDLRRPNLEALDAVAKHVVPGDGREVIADLATGVGKTYLAAALIDYLAQQGVRNVLIVVPGSTILRKTIRNFTPGDDKFVPGAEMEPLLVTNENFARAAIGDSLHDARKLKVFLFTVQTLISPSAKTARKTYEDNESIGDALYSHLQNTEDLVVIVDEHHVVREKAKRFNAAVHDLGARAVVGLTATPDATDVAAGKVVYRYPLAAAIADRLVKIPVVVYRADGRKDLQTQLADACSLRAAKEPVWAAFAQAAERDLVHPVLFVVAQTIADAQSIASELRRDDLLPGEDAVLLVTGESPESDLEQLERVESADSPVRAIVSVDKLKEGWDVRNVAVIMADRALASDTLTEQILGRGLRLPFGRRTDLGAIDQVDIVAHESYATLLRNKDALAEKLVGTLATTPGPSGASVPDVQIDFSGLDSTDADDPSSGFKATAMPPGTNGAIELSGLGAAEILHAQEQSAHETQATADVMAVGAVMPRNDFPPIIFPTQERLTEPARFSLADVSMTAVNQHGQVFSHDPQVKLVRRALDAHRDINGDVRVIDRLVDAAEATRVTVSAEAIKMALLGRVIHSGLVEPELTERLLAVDLVDAFLAGAGIDHGSDWEWSVEHAERAENDLYSLIRAAHKGRKTTSSWRWAEAGIPIARPKPTATRGVWDSFVKGAWTGPWERSVDKYAKFDSASAELLLAQKLDTWDEVRCWQRLYQPGPAWILWKGGRYYPDFVVVDQDGTHWVVEAKADKAAIDSLEVQDKAAAARGWVEKVNDSRLFGDWRYVIATEAQIAAAVDWTQLV
jgi:type III restriction enzyme